MSADFATKEKIAETERLIRPHIRQTPVAIIISGANTTAVSFAA
ncbi:MAG: hypothetical protein ACOZAA_14920 [Pseudomonadota bacterium]